MLLHKKLSALAAVCDADERELIEEMVLGAAAYIQIVTEMECKKLNLAGREGEEYRSTVSEADTRRTHLHDSFITQVNIVNRICETHGHDKIYDGTDDRRAYARFALMLVGDIFKAQDPIFNLATFIPIINGLT